MIREKIVHYIKQALLTQKGYGSTSKEKELPPH